MTKTVMLAAPLLVLLLAACGAQEDAGTTADMPAVESPAPDGAALVVKACLDLVAEERYEAALQACSDALDAAPESAAARSALERARAASGS